MADVLTPAQRRYCMSQIRGKNTKPEIYLRRALSAIGLRYRLKNVLPGKPDIVFPAKRVAVFVDGCFWHGCPRHSVRPKSNRKFWDTKIKTNKKRDENVNKLLKKCGWRVIRIWEHEIESNLEQCVAKIRIRLKNPGLAQTSFISRTRKKSHAAYLRR